MQESIEDYRYSIELALDNAKKRLDILEGFDKNSIFDEYKEWLKDGLNKHKVLLLREDPII